MRQFFRALGSVLLVAGIVALSVGPAAANPRYAGMVVNAANGEVFYQDDADELRYPASLTKVMTLYLLFEALEAGQLTLDTPLSVSAQAAAQPPSKIGLGAGDSIRVEDAIYALAVKSANDIAVVVAEALAGSESAFAREMTETARRIGMVSTTFRNASGLPNSQQRTTARDMIRLGIAVRARFPQYYAYFSATSWTYRGTTYRSHNRLLSSYDGMDGLKTGYINASGFNLLASAERGELRLMAVVFGGRSGASRNEHMADLLDRAFESERGRFLIANGIDLPDVPLPPRPPGLGPILLAEGDPSIAPRFDSPILPPRRPVFARAPIQLASAAQALPQQALAPQPQGAGAPTTPAAEASRPDPATMPVIAAASGTALPVPAQGDGADGWGIQVGAFSTPESGAFALEQAGVVLNDLIAGAAGRITPVETPDGGTLYRARLHGLDEDAAMQACIALHDLGSPCLPLAPHQTL